MFSRVGGSAGSDCRNRYVGSPQPPWFGHERPPPVSFIAGPGDGSLSSPGLHTSDTDSQISLLCSGSTTVRWLPPMVMEVELQRSSLAMYMYWSSRTFRRGCRAAA